LRASSEDGDAVHLGVGTTVEEAEKRLILKTLESTNNNKTRAAEILGISLKTLHNKLRLYRDRGLLPETGELPPAPADASKAPANFNS